VFISYSCAPQENAQFARDLAGRLRIAGFEVWLDEERIPAGAQIANEIKRAVDQSDVGLFIVTARWLQREWTQHEVRLFASRSVSRRLVVIREAIDLGDLGPHLGGLKTIAWSEQDPEPDARFWQIYCGIVGIGPGPEENWAKEGRRVAASPAPAPTNATVEGTMSHQPGDRIKLPFSGRPIQQVSGEKCIFLVSDAGEWMEVAINGAFKAPLARLTDFSAAICGPKNQLVVGLYVPMVARLRKERWEYLPQEAPVFCFAQCPESIFVGTSAGRIGLIGEGDSAPSLRIRDPVIALTYCEGMLFGIGAHGMFGKSAWPPPQDDAFRWIQTKGLGRPVGFFQAAESNHVGVFSYNRVGVLDPGSDQIMLSAQIFEEGIREVIFLGAQTRPYAVLTDEGSLILLDAALRRGHVVHFAGDAVTSGCAMAGWHSALTWTNLGDLYLVSPDGTLEQIASEGVILAYSPDPSDRVVHIVRSSGNQSNLEALSLS
jgi:hypothetical protein